MRNLYDWLPEQTRWPFYLPLAAAFQLYFSLWFSISCHSPLSEHLERVFDNKYQNSHFKNFLFQLLTWKSKLKSVNSAGKSAFKFTKLPSLKVSSCKLSFTDDCIVGGNCAELCLR